MTNEYNTMTNEEALQLKKWLFEEGYGKCTQSLTTNEHYGYFKSFTDDNDELLYQIEYRFWDWNRYRGGEGFGVDIIIITNGEHRADLEFSPVRNIDDTERIAKEFYEFCKQRGLI